jgi:aspartyl-tRNA(Asn)/glutamyl-tRNA(Gln) amidotransferase subunit A
MELNKLTIKEAHQGLREKKFSSVELTKACLEQIKSKDEKIKSFLTVTEEVALKKATQADQAGDFTKPLTGIPAGIKDIFCTKDVRSTGGSKILDNYVPAYNATTVDKIEDQGSVMVGKTNCDEFAMGTSGENSGYFPTHNPWDLTRVPGGSSSGSAAAVAAHMCLYALGTDTGGSIREPASFCSITGLKVTYGRVSRYGVMAMASSLDTIGPLTKNVEDAAIVLKEIAGHDPKDSTTPQEKVDDYPAEIKKDIKGLKIGLAKEKK